MKKSIRKILSFALATTLLVGCSPKTKDSSSGLTFKAGTYTATAKGHNNDMKFEVVVSDTEILEVNILDHAESAGIADLPLENIPKEIVAGQTLAIDSISGATYTSDAILAGVEAALTEAGADIKALKVKKDTEKEEAKHIEKEADVIVIGGGGAGLAAAASATENGASVILVEKMPKLGGNTLLAGGGYNAVDPKRQDPQGIEDSIDLHYTQTLEASDSKGNPDLVRVLVEGAYPGIEWLESMGMKFKDTVQMITGSLHERTHSSEKALGVEYINVLEAAVEKNGGEILLNTSAEELIVEDGKVVGVQATATNGDTLTLSANNGVILASGGFGANVEMREAANAKTKAWPSLDETIKTTNDPGATGDGLVMAEAIGASLINLGDIQLLPLGDLENGSLKGKLGKSPKDYIHVNKEGKRFVSEDSRRDVLTYALLEQTDKTMFIIDANEDPELGKKIFGNKIDKGPFYACPRVPTVHHTMGGLEINTNTEVLDTEGNVIPGLYAAGEVTGGIHGTNRVGGNAFADIIVFGRLAGETAAKNK